VGKIILFCSVSIDGMFEDADGSLEWATVDEELHQHFNDELKLMGAFLGGRVSYEMMAEYWPTADQDPSAPATIIEYAGIWRSMPQVVYSRTLESVGPNATLVRSVDPLEVEELKRATHGDMVMGGAVLSATFLDLDLLDEVWLYVHPVVLGQGRRLFGDRAAPWPLSLESTRTFTSGVVMLRYGRRAAS